MKVETYEDLRKAILDYYWGRFYEAIRVDWDIHIGLGYDGYFYDTTSPWSPHFDGLIVSEPAGQMAHTVMCRAEDDKCEPSEAFVRIILNCFVYEFEEQVENYFQYELDNPDMDVRQIVKYCEDVLNYEESERHNFDEEK